MEEWGWILDNENAGTCRSLKCKRGHPICRKGQCLEQLYFVAFIIFDEYCIHSEEGFARIFGCNFFEVYKMG